MTAREALQTYFGYPTFRPLQEEIIESVITKRDTFALLPTGAGKSLCYQLPSILMSQGTTIVISPLIALMKDQVDALVQNGIKAAFLNSTLTSFEQQRVIAKLNNCELTLLYIAPERAVQETFVQLLKNIKINLFAIDEAHCISQWGHDFRPEYRQLQSLRQHFPNIPIIALTATATTRVKEDIMVQLSLHSPAIFIGSFNRPNLSYHIAPKYHAHNELNDILQRHTDQSGIIYCQSRKIVEELAEYLKSKGHKALPYHAGHEDKVRQHNQEKFINDEYNIIVATIAFGMGINKPDVRFVIHYNMPKSLEHYYQETGRAGRDGLPAACYMQFSYADKILYERFINKMTNQTEQAIARQQLNLIVRFAQSSVCRRSQLLSYFDEHTQVECNNCDNCVNPKETYDATIPAQQIMSCIYRTGQRFAAPHIADILKGSKNKKVLQFNHHQLSTYNLMPNIDTKEIKNMMYDLVQQGILAQSQDQFATLKLTEKAKSILKQNDRVYLTKQLAKPSKRQQSEATGSQYDLDLFEQLRKLRLQLAREKSLPPYMIFSDRSLQDMAVHFPQTIEEFSSIYGVGEKKAETYGLVFIDTISHYYDKRNSRK